MSMEVGNELWLGHNPSGLLGQFASTQGYTDLIKAAKKYKLATLREWFSSGVTGDVEAARSELKALAKDAGSDVASTAKTLRDLIDGQKIAIITNGGN
jgi:hypothetical protein